MADVNSESDESTAREPRHATAATATAGPGFKFKLELDVPVAVARVEPRIRAACQCTVTRRLNTDPEQPEGAAAGVAPNLKPHHHRPLALERWPDAPMAVPWVCYIRMCSQ